MGLLVKEEPKKSRNAGGHVLVVRNVPAELRQEFKLYSWEHGKHLAEMLIEYMQKCVAERRKRLKHKKT